MTTELNIFKTHKIVPDIDVVKEVCMLDVFDEDNSIDVCDVPSTSFENKLNN